MDIPSSLARDISPPRPLKRRKTSGTTPKTALDPIPKKEPTLAAVEAGKANVDDHLTYFANHLAKSSRQTPPDVPRLPLHAFTSLYQFNQHEHGHHFVVHQHNHPRAGVHYDLRLQFSATSSVSFAIPKGLPGNPNSRSKGRMAIETRVHCLWNHLIESAGAKTGSLLIWDTGTYEVLPRKKEKSGIPSPQTTDEEEDEEDHSDVEAKASAGRDRDGEGEHENEKLTAAFQTRYMRLRLHGTRLPRNYTIILRLPSNDIAKGSTARRKKRWQKSSVRSQAQPNLYSNTDSGTQDEQDTQREAQDQDTDLDTDSEEDAQTRTSNAYPGATNSIGSMHQRHWFLQLDRQSSGFVLDKKRGGKEEWRRTPDGGGFESFLVRGRDHERSVVTGRLARDVESDEGIEGFVGRGGWTGIEH